MSGYGIFITFIMIMFGADRMTREKSGLATLVNQTWSQCIEAEMSGNSISDAKSKPYGRDILVQKLKPGAREQCQYYVMKENLFVDRLRTIQTEMAVNKLKSRSRLVSQAVNIIG